MKLPQYRGVIIKNHLTRRKCFLVKRLAAHPKFVELRKIRDERSGGGGFKKKQGGGVGTPLPLPFNSNSKSDKAALALSLIKEGTTAYL